MKENNEISRKILRIEKEMTDEQEKIIEALKKSERIKTSVVIILCLIATSLCIVYAPDIAEWIVSTAKESE